MCSKFRSNVWIKVETKLKRFVTAGFLPVFTLLLCYTLPKSSILCCNLKPTPPPHMQSSIVGSCCHLRPGPGLACVLLTPNSGVDPTQPAGCKREEGKICLSKGGWDVGMSGWMEQRTGHVTPALDDHVSVTVITVIITAYMMKWQKVLMLWAQIQAAWKQVSVVVLRGLLGRVSRLSSSSVTIYSILMWTFGFCIFFM